MKIRLLPLLCIATMLCAQSCDFFRFIAGRPTSKDIAAMIAENIKEQSTPEIEDVDSLVDGTKSAAISDSETVVAELSDSQPSDGNVTNILDACIVVRDLSNLKVTFLLAPTHKYNLILGAFGNAENAQNLVSKLVSSGFDAEILQYASGMMVVSIPADDVSVISEKYSRLSESLLCPEDAWLFIYE